MVLLHILFSAVCFMEVGFVVVVCIVLFVLLGVWMSRVIIAPSLHSLVCKYAQDKSHEYSDNCKRRAACSVGFTSSSCFGKRTRCSL